VRRFADELDSVRDAVKQQVGEIRSRWGAKRAALRTESFLGLGFSRREGKFHIGRSLQKVAQFLQQALTHVGKFDRGWRFVCAKDGGENIFLRGKGIEHSFFDGVFGDEIDDLHRGFLSVTMGAGDALFEHGGIPREVEVDDEAGGLQVEPHAARVGGEEDAAFGVVEEFLDEVAAFGGGNRACEFDVAETDALQDGFGKFQHVRPLAEYNGFVSIADAMLSVRISSNSVSLGAVFSRSCGSISLSCRASALQIKRILMRYIRSSSRSLGVSGRRLDLEISLASCSLNSL
jgi:hypothetical protein